MMKHQEPVKASTVINLLTIELPLFLFGFNYVMYNALPLESAKTIIRMIAIVLLAGGCLYRHRDFSPWNFVLLGVAALSLAASRMTDINLFVMVAVVSCLPKGSDRIPRSELVITLISMLVVIVAVLTGNAENYVYTSEYGRDRMTLGFNNANTASVFYFSILFLFLLSCRKLTVWHIAGVVVIGGVLYYLTDTRTAILSLLLMSAFILLYKIPNDRWKSGLLKGAIWFVDALFLLNLVSVFFLDQLEFIDEFTSFRISQFQRLREAGGVIGFFFGGVEKTTDCLFYTLLYHYGIFFYLLFAVMAHITMARLCRKKDYVKAAFMLSMFCFSVMETILLRPEILISIVFWLYMISENIDFLNERFPNALKFQKLRAKFSKKKN